jgi:hypothetical protein
MKRLATVLALLAAPLLSAQDTIRKMVDVKYANANAISTLVANLGVNAHADNQLKAIVLAGTPETVARAEEAIKRLDVPPPHEKNIELLAYLVLASNEATPGPESAELAPAIKQMRSLFQYKSYRLLDTIWVRTKEHDSLQSSGLAPAALKLDPNFEPTYQLNARRASIVSPDTVRLEDFSLTLVLRVVRTSQNNADVTSVRINSSFDVREGQKVVIGKTNATGADSAVILVVTAKIVD